jgi:hypothetical protein
LARFSFHTPTNFGGIALQYSISNEKKVNAHNYYRYFVMISKTNQEVCRFSMPIPYLKSEDSEKIQEK